MDKASGNNTTKQFDIIKPNKSFTCTIGVIHNLIVTSLVSAPKTALASACKKLTHCKKCTLKYKCVHLT